MELPSLKFHVCSLEADRSRSSENVDLCVTMVENHSIGGLVVV